MKKLLFILSFASPLSAMEGPESLVMEDTQFPEKKVHHIMGEWAEYTVGCGFLESSMRELLSERPRLNADGYLCYACCSTPASRCAVMTVGCACCMGAQIYLPTLQSIGLNAIAFISYQLVRRKFDQVKYKIIDRRLRYGVLDGPEGYSEKQE